MEGPNTVNIWESINQEHTSLLRLLQEYQELQTQLLDKSLIRNEKALESIVVKFDAGALANITNDKLLLSEKISQIKNFSERLETNLMTLTFTDLSTSDHQKKLKPDAFKLYLGMVEYLGKPSSNQNIANPLRHYVQIVHHLNYFVKTLDFVQFLYSFPVPELSKILIEKVRVLALRNTTHQDLTNWPNIKNALLLIRNLAFRIEEERSSSAKILHPKELDNLIKKLRLVSTYIFNSSDIRKGLQFPDLPSLEFDLFPYMPKKEAPLSEFITTRDYVSNTFREVVKFFNYEIGKVSGDGNCFFRAVVKSTLGSVPKEWEDDISLKLRQKANSGCAKRLESEGQISSYPYLGFVIPDVNDSITMAKAGVWADHIQLSKLSVLLKTPFHIVSYDDNALKIDHNGTLKPGSNYLVQPQQPCDSSRPILLFFTPVPGHYEALIRLPAPFLTFNSTSISNQPNMLTSETSLLTSSPNSILSQLENLYSATLNSPPDSFISLCPPKTLCILFFYLDYHVNQLLSEIYSNGKISYPADFSARIKDILKAIQVFQSLLAILGKCYLETLPSSPQFQIYEDLIWSLLQDELFFDGPTPCLVRPEKGPLSKLVSALLQEEARRSYRC